MIPGFIIAIATFPGVIVHEIAHQLFCRLFRVAVFEVCYFRVGSPAGYVVHETPRTVAAHLWISVGPFIVNSLIGAVIAMPAAIPVLKFEAASPLDYVLIWLGVSITMHAFPSTGDAQSMWDALQNPKTTVIAKLIGMPLIGLIYLGAIGSFIWVDLLYGVGVALLTPTVLIRLFV